MTTTREQLFASSPVPIPLGTDCVICYNELTEQNHPIQLRCNPLHVYCRSCLVRWFEGHGRCIFRCEIRPWDLQEGEEGTEEEYESEEEGDDEDDDEEEDDEVEEDDETVDDGVDIAADDVGIDPHNVEDVAFEALSRALRTAQATFERQAAEEIASNRRSAEELASNRRFVETAAGLMERTLELQRRLAEAQERIQELEERLMDPTRRQVEMLGRIVVLRRRYAQDGQRLHGAE